MAVSLVGPNGDSLPGLMPCGFYSLVFRPISAVRVAPRCLWIGVSYQFSNHRFRVARLGQASAERVAEVVPVQVKDVSLGTRSRKRGQKSGDDTFMVKLLFLTSETVAIIAQNE
jgi:hypothetical protein